MVFSKGGHFSDFWGEFSNEKVFAHGGLSVYQNFITRRKKKRG